MKKTYTVSIFSFFILLTVGVCVWKYTNARYFVDSFRIRYKYSDKSNWTKYKSKEIGVSFKYPAPFIKHADKYWKEDFSLNPEKAETYNLTFNKDKDYFYFGKMINWSPNHGDNKPCVYCTEKVTINGRVWWISPRGTRCDAGECFDTMTVYSTADGKKSYSFAFYPEGMESIVLEIIKTFKIEE